MGWQAIEQGISAAGGEPFRVESSRALSGGCINRAYRVSGGGRSFFVKINDAALLPMFEAEAAGLEAILASGAIRVPRPIALGVAGPESWLALEFIAFGRGGAGSEVRLGEQLAALHRHTAPAFGWTRDNFIGATPQPNTPGASWTTFLAECRLGFQLQLAEGNGAPARLLDSGRALIERLPRFFPGGQPPASLLHGDLWGGNWACDETGEPLVFDPAVYYGDRESDLAMSELFGGFGDRFYQSYRSCWDIDPGYANRKVIYQLYHVLNHFNLFGGGYAAQAQGMIASLLALS